METLSDRIDSSWTAVRDGGTAFLTQTSRAGRAFLARSQVAGVAFGRSVRNDAVAWRGWASARLVRALDGTALERGLWRRVADLLAQLEAATERRLERLDAPEQQETQVSPPFEDYPALTAKEVIARLDDLSADECLAVQTFEGAHKNRATVLRALTQRLAA